MPFYGKQHGRETWGDVMVSDASWAEPKIVINNFAMRQVTSGGGGADMAALGEKQSWACATQMCWNQMKCGC